MSRVIEQWLKGLGFLSKRSTWDFGMRELPLKSSILGIHWPAVPDPRGTALLAILFQLEQSQWWSVERLLDRQLHQFGLLLNHAHRTVPFYRERLKQIGIVPDGPVPLEATR